jgi:AcrR family transcriptional regulator
VKDRDDHESSDEDHSLHGGIIAAVSSERRGRGRPRREGADEEILAAVRSMLDERGYRELSVDAVAERAGVAKTTIYRRWSSKGVLVAAAIAPSPVSASSAHELLLETEALLAPLADAGDDAEILGVVRAILLPRRAALAQLLDNSTRADELLGALWMRMWMGNELRMKN